MPYNQKRTLIHGENLLGGRGVPFPHFSVKFACLQRKRMCSLPVTASVRFRRLKSKKVHVCYSYLLHQLHIVTQLHIATET